jgi:hypothetical protein
MTFSTCPACGAKTPDLDTHLSIKRDRVHAAKRISIDMDSSLLGPNSSDVRLRGPRPRTSSTRKQGHRL